ncbi:hypothetical protein PY247_12860 [Acinetobacter proteolyticus]|nr:hypothetical protein [Acinetobacter proteolyticus]WEI17381.1 hypothetical protein PY247_12860 [Acinetobacter proteolyticus]
MKAITFIKQHGVEKAKEELKKLPNSDVTHMTDDARMFIDENNPLLDEFQRSQIKDLICIEELRRLVDSVELVRDHYTLDRAIDYANSAYTAPEIKVCLLDAIADYKSIYGGKHV